MFNLLAFGSVLNPNLADNIWYNIDFFASQLVTLGVGSCPKINILKVTCHVFAFLS